MTIARVHQLHTVIPNFLRVGGHAPISKNSWELSFYSIHLKVFLNKKSMSLVTRKIKSGGIPASWGTQNSRRIFLSHLFSNGVPNYLELETCQQIKPNYFFCVLALRDVFSRVWEPFVILHYCQIMVKNRWTHHYNCESVVASDVWTTQQQPMHSVWYFCLHLVSIWNVWFPISQLKQISKTIFRGIQTLLWKSIPKSLS